MTDRELTKVYDYLQRIQREKVSMKVFNLARMAASIITKEIKRNGKKKSRHD